MLVLAAMAANLAMVATVAASGFLNSPSGTATIAGAFGLAGVILQGLILRQSKRNEEIARAVSSQVGVARKTAHESARELVKAGVHRDPKGRDRRPKDRGGGRREDDPPSTNQ